MKTLLVAFVLLFVCADYASSCWSWHSLLDSTRKSELYNEIATKQQCALITGYPLRRRIFATYTYDAVCPDHVSDTEHNRKVLGIPSSANFFTIHNFTKDVMSPFIPFVSRHGYVCEMLDVRTDKCRLESILLDKLFNRQTRSTSESDPEVDDPEVEKPKVDDPKVDDPMIDDPKVDSDLLDCAWIPSTSSFNLTDF